MGGRPTWWSGTGLKAFPAVLDMYKFPPRGPRGVSRPSKRFGEGSEGTPGGHGWVWWQSRRFGTGLKALHEVREWSKFYSRGP